MIRATGELVFIDNAFGDASGTINVKARFANTGEFLVPGAFHDVIAIVETDPAAITIPEQALQQGQVGPYVYTVEDGKSKLQSITVSRILDGSVVVSDGLSGGETVVLSISTNLRDGSAVDVKQALAKGPVPVTAP